MKNIISTFTKSIALAGFVMAAASLSAHTISIGTYNAGGVGDVTITMGTYTSGHGSLFSEGFISLTTGPSSPLGPIAFGSLVFTKPGALIDGVNNLFADGSGGYTALTNTTGQPITNWQSATFNGLLAGTYTYVISGMNAVNWANWDTGQANWTGTLVIPETSVSGVPDAGSSLALFGLALMGLAAVRRKLA